MASYTQYPSLDPSNCGNTVNNCNCSDTPTDPVVYSCPDPEKCEEIISTDCIVYTGDNIECPDAATLHPLLADLYYLVKGNSSIDQRRLTTILNNINSQLCYILSKDFIAQYLTIIQNDADLSQLFCDISCSCNCIAPPSCDITCLSGNAGKLSAQTDSGGNTTGLTFQLNPQTSVLGHITYIIHWYELISGTYVKKGVQTLSNPVTTQNITLTGLTAGIPNNVTVLVYASVDNSNPLCAVGAQPADTFTVSAMLSIECNKFGYTVPFVPCRTIETFTAAFVS